MPLSLHEYAASLNKRSDFDWPEPPKLVDIAARPHLKHIEGIRAVMWNLYGTLLRISDGDLMQFHFKPSRMQPPLERTIAEFRMQSAIGGDPAAAAALLYQQYKRVFEHLEQANPATDTEFPQISSAEIWRLLINQMIERGYAYEEARFGDLSAFASKVAYYFHSCFQGVQAVHRAQRAIGMLSNAGFVQGLLAEAQEFSLLELERCFQKQDPSLSLDSLFAPNCRVLSHQFGVRKPSRILYETAVRKLADLRISPRETLYVSTRLAGDLAVAREFGFRTVLFAGDKTSLKASVVELNHPDLKPKRLVTDLTQISQIVAPGN